MINAQARLQAAGIFLSAADYIRQFGWQKEGMGEYGQPRCSMGALASANPEVVWDKDTSKLMYDVLYEMLEGMSLTQYNSKFQSGEKVAKLFERTARKLTDGSF